MTRGCIVRVSPLLAPFFLHSSPLLFSSLLTYSLSSPCSYSPSLLVVGDHLPFPLKDLPSQFRILLPSNPARLPFKGTEISFGDIKPPFNRLLIQVGFSNFFLSSPGRPKRAVMPLFVCVPRTGTEGWKQPAVTSSRSYSTMAFASRERIATVRAGDRLLPSRSASFGFLFPDFSIFHSLLMSLSHH